MKRSNDEKIIGMPVEVAINGKQCKVKRLKVREVNELIAAKMDRTKKAQSSQMKLAKIQLAVQNGNLESLGIAEEDVDKAIEDIQAMLGEMAIEAGGAHNMWLIESCVEANKADLEDIEFDEYDAAVDAIFEVNPSLGKSKEMLLMNPFQMNQNG